MVIFAQQMTNTMKKFNAYSCTQIYVLIFKTN